MIYVVWSQLFTWSADRFISWHESAFSPMKFTRWWLLPKRRKIYPRFKIGCTCNPTTYSTIRLVLFPAFIRHLVSISTSTWWSDIRTFLLHALEDGQDPLPDVSCTHRGRRGYRATEPIPEEEDCFGERNFPTSALSRDTISGTFGGTPDFREARGTHQKSTRGLNLCFCEGLVLFCIVLCRVYFICVN